MKNSKSEKNEWRLSTAKQFFHTTIVRSDARGEHKSIFLFVLKTSATLASLKFTKFTLVNDLKGGECYDF